MHVMLTDDPMFVCKSILFQLFFQRKYFDSNFPFDRIFIVYRPPPGKHLLAEKLLFFFIFAQHRRSPQK